LSFFYYYSSFENCVGSEEKVRRIRLKESRKVGVKMLQKWFCLAWGETKHWKWKIFVFVATYVALL